MIRLQQLKSKRNQIELLKQRVLTATMNLEARKKTLEAMKASRIKTPQPAPATRRQVSPYEAVAQYARKKGFLGAVAIREGRGDPGHVRDIGDAALFGSALAATVMADLALNAVTEDKERQQAEGLAWLDLAAQLDRANDGLKQRAEDLRSRMSQDAIQQSKLNLTVILDRRAVLTRPSVE